MYTDGWEALAWAWAWAWASLGIGNWELGIGIGIYGMGGGMYCIVLNALVYPLVPAFVDLIC